MGNNQTKPKYNLATGHALQASGFLIPQNSLEKYFKRHARGCVSKTISTQNRRIANVLGIGRGFYSIYAFSSRDCIY